MFESLHFHRIEISFFEKGFRLYAFGFPALLISTYLTINLTEKRQYMRMTEQERRIRIRHLKRMYRIRERKERHDKKVSGLFMKRVVFTLILAAFIFTVVMIFVFLRMGSEPSTLIENVFRFLSVEGGAMALIKSVKTVKGTKSNGEIQHNDEPEQNDEEVQG